MACRAVSAPCLSFKAFRFFSPASLMSSRADSYALSWGGTACEAFDGSRRRDDVPSLDRRVNMLEWIEERLALRAVRDVLVELGLDDVYDDV